METSVPRRAWWRRVRLSIRGLMVLVLVVGGGLGWFIHRAAVQRDAVRAIQAAGGTVSYDYQQARPFDLYSAPPGPKWLVDRIGLDFFATVTSVTIKTPQTDAILAHVGQLPRLQYLSARGVSVTDASLAHLAGLSELRGLGLSATPGLTDAGLAHLAGLARLENLVIEGDMRVEGPGLAHLTGLKRLKFLCIETRTDADWAILARLAGLRKLFLGTTRVTDEGVAQLACLTQLEDLAFGGETGSDAGLSRLSALTRLERLTVYGAWFTDAGLVPVAEMDHLPAFAVSDTTSVTPEGLNHLQRQRPKLQVGVNGTGRVPRARTNLLRRAVGPVRISNFQPTPN